MPHLHKFNLKSIINKDLTILLFNPAICKYDIRDIPDTLFAKRPDKMAGGFVNYFCGIINCSHKHVKRISKSGSSIPDAMCKVEPSFGSFNRNRSLAVLHFVYRVIDFGIQNFLMFNFSIYDGIRKPNAIPPPLPVSIKPSCGRVKNAYFPSINQGCNTTL